MRPRATALRARVQLEPRGVEYTFTLVVSFHPIFLTKIDRAYRLRCFYMEAVKTVNTQLDVRCALLLAFHAGRARSARAA